MYISDEQKQELIHDLLAEDGSIYVHCDWRVSGYMRLVWDEIFGKENFRSIGAIGLIIERWILTMKIALPLCGQKINPPVSGKSGTPANLYLTTNGKVSVPAVTGNWN